MSTLPPLHPAMPPPQSDEKRNPWLFPVVIAVIAAVIAVVIAAPFIFRYSGSGAAGSAEFVSVAHSPQNPLPGENVTVTIEARNATECGVQTQQFFVLGGGSSFSTGGLGVTTCEFDLGSFLDGTEVWYVASLVGYDGNSVLSQDNTFQVGDVERSQITTLSIANITHSPQSPTLSDGLVEVFAEISSNKSIIYKEIAYMIYAANDSIGSGNQFMTAMSGNLSKGEIIYGYFTEYFSSSEGIKICYRIGAKDSLGNTALTEVYCITLS